MPETPADILVSDQIKKICDRHYGAGSDGILFGPLPSVSADFALRIFNPDGSEAEKSGNGLRIFARFLWDQKILKIDHEDKLANTSMPFTIHTMGGIVRAEVFENGNLITLGMGRASFRSRFYPLNDLDRKEIIETMRVEGAKMKYCAVNLGNPHCVVLNQAPTPETAQRYGPLIEKSPLFPEKTNVQFLQVLDPDNLQIEIWERGAGTTLSSGSSSCAAAAAAFYLGLCKPQVTVHNPGGNLTVSISDQLDLILTGSARKVYEGFMEME